MKYVAIIPTVGYNDNLVKCLRNLDNSEMKPAAIIVGDAGADTDVENLCRGKYVYLKRQKDGFAANVNAMLKEAANPKYAADAAFLLGSDVFVIEDTTRQLMDNLYFNRITQGFVLDTNKILRKRPPAGFTDCMSGNCAMIPLEWQRKHNIWFNEKLFCYGEDTQFGYDWQASGGTILQLYTYAVHEHAHYFNTAKNTKKYYYLMRNSLYVGKLYPAWRIHSLKIAAGLLVLKFSKDTVHGLIDYIRGIQGPHPEHIL